MRGRTDGRNRLIDLFQVVTGGHLDIDVKLYSPDSNVIFEVSFSYNFKPSSVLGSGIHGPPSDVLVRVGP